MYSLEDGKRITLSSSPYKLINAASKSVSHMGPVYLQFWENWGNKGGKDNSERNSLAKFKEITDSWNSLPSLFWDFCTVLISLSWENILIPDMLCVILYPLLKSWSFSCFFCDSVVLEILVMKLKEISIVHMDLISWYVSTPDTCTPCLHDGSLFCCCCDKSDCAF